jgi:hypothetical protein
MKRHRAQCNAWKTRHRGTVQMARLAETLEANHGAGVTNPRQVPGTEEKRKATILERYGAENVFSRSSALFHKVQEAAAPYRPILRGADNPFSWPDVQEKIRETNLAKYGVENPQQTPDVRTRTHATNQERYGNEEVLASPAIREKIVATNQERYGGPYPMMNKDYALKMLERMKRPGPNLPERLLHGLAPELLYTGDGKFWRWLPKLGHHKNPDFILPGLDPEEPRRGVTKVVEMFGDFWHSRMFTGKANLEHEQELVEAFREVGIDCLIVWESEVKKARDAVSEKLRAFLDDIR